MSTLDASSGVMRYDVHDPEDLAYLIRTGLIWRGGPKTQRLAIDALLSGAVPRPGNLPEQIAAFLDSSQQDRIEEPSGATHIDSALADDAPSRKSVAPASAPWACPDHGSSSLVTLTSREGRVYGACTADDCEWFEGLQPATNTADLFSRAAEIDAQSQGTSHPEAESATDYTFPEDDGFLEHVTFRTSLIDGRLYGRIIGTFDRSCEYSADDDDSEYTDHHLIDVSTEYVDLATAVDLSHRVALIETSHEIREYYAHELFRRAYRKWSHEDCVHKPAYEARMRVLEEAAHAKAEARAKAPPGLTSFGTAMTPALDNLEETAVQDGELAARAIDYASRYGRLRRVQGQAVADRFYESLNNDPSEWDELCGALILSARADLWIELTRRFGTDGVAQVTAPYRASFVAELERHLHRLGKGGWPTEDPGGPIAPWLQLLAALERASKPSLARRLFGKRG